ncbi:MAG: hypothetical protein K2Z81_04115, partial [Cyanobacteria bacterium]|nr:hypothetical protein [Cyanobacteriota bacterium]
MIRPSSFAPQGARTYMAYLFYSVDRRTQSLLSWSASSHTSYALNLKSTAMARLRAMRLSTSQEFF